MNKGFATILVLLVVVLVGGVGVGWYLSNTGIIPKFSGPAITEQPPAPPPVPETGEAASWKSFEFEIAGVEFQLPPSFNNKDWHTLLLNEDNDKMVEGSKACFTAAGPEAKRSGSGLCPNDPPFSVQATSVDFAAPRGGGFGDLIGFKKEGGKYYLDSQSGPYKVNLDWNSVEEIQNSNQVNIIKIKQKKDPTDEESIPLLGKDTVGAIINTSSPKYPGIVLTLKLNKGMSEEEFDQILSTFKFLD